MTPPKLFFLAESSAVTMNDVGACMDVVLAMPSLQELARRANCLGRTLSGEYSQLCLHFISLCVQRAGNAYDALADEVGEEVARGRSILFGEGCKVGHT